MSAVTKSRTEKIAAADDRREQLRKAYLFVVNNWAVDDGDIAKGLGIERKQATSLAKSIERKGLIVREQVNGEGALINQSFYDIDNSNVKETRKSARADFAAAFPEGSVKEPAASRSGGKGATGPRYTEEQIKKGAAARKAGKSNAEVAKAAGVKSPAYFTAVLKARGIVKGSK
jgi:hypothetical protein